jgi:hypothetical protein
MLPCVLASQWQAAVRSLTPVSCDCWTSGETLAFGQIMQNTLWNNTSYAFDPKLTQVALMWVTHLG